MSRRLQWHILSIAIGLAMMTASAIGEVPRTISYQGRLTDNLGAPVVDANYNLNFRIWNDPVSVALANLKWESGAVSVATVSGLFNVNLGAPGQAALPESLFVQDTARWMSISVNGAADLTPRTKLTSVAYAYVAGTVPDSSLSSYKITDEAGLTSASITFSVNIPAVATMSDIVSTSITTPGFGFVLVVASSQIGHSESATEARYVIAQIDQTSGGGEDGSHSAYYGTLSSTANLFRFVPVCYSRLYFVGPGTLTFRLEAMDNTPGSAEQYFWSPRIHAIYFPTYYGLLFAAQAVGTGFGEISRAYTDEEIAAGRVPQVDPSIRQSQVEMARQRQTGE